jgi:acid phosphatase class B
MTTVFIVDIDGTICNSMPRVQKICETYNADVYDNLDDIWTKDVMEDFLKEENIMSDKVIKGAENLFNLADRCNAVVRFLTGRSEYGRRATRKWLTKIYGASPHTPLIMRPKHMKGVPTPECKEQLFRELYYYKKPEDTYIFFEDETETAKRYSRYGLVLKSPECWAVLGDNL